MTRGTIWRMLLVATVAAVAFAEPALAHGIGGAAATGSAPLWFVLLVGGAVVGGSFLFATLLTDHAAIKRINEWRLEVPVPAAVQRGAATALAALGVLALVAILAVGLAGPRDGVANLAVLAVFGVWWAGYTMSVYLVGNTWPALNPWRALSSALPRVGDRSLPDVGDWPAALGLLGVVWVEVVSPVGENPRLLAVVVVAYTAVTLAGASVYGDDWFRRVDPLTRVFRAFGRLAPFQRTDDGLALAVPGAPLADPTAGGDDEPVFVVALLWGTTFDGLVSTPPWAALAGTLVDAGVPAGLVYLAGLLGGFGLFVAAYRVAAGWSRETADSLLDPRYIGRWFVPALLPIAAGYHVAHFLGFFVRLWPPLSAALANPTAPAAAGLAPLPGWYGGLQLVFVLAGHVFAIWIAHGLSFDLFPGRLQPIRSQYPFTAVMILYTMTSMWIVAQPHVDPPGV